MKFNKTKTLRNLRALATAIEDREYNALISDRDDVDLDRLKNDRMFVRGLMDDIECDRITELPTEEVA